MGGRKWKIATKRSGEEKKRKILKKKTKSFIHLHTITKETANFQQNNNKNNNKSSCKNTTQQPRKKKTTLSYPNPTQPKPTLPYPTLEQHEFACATSKDILLALKNFFQVWDACVYVRARILIRLLM